MTTCRLAYFSRQLWQSFRHLDLVSSEVRISGIPPQLELIIALEVTIGQVAIPLGIGAGIEGEHIVDVPHLAFQASIRGHFEVVLSETNHCRYLNHLRVEK